jgi:hypothetical protein
MVAGGMSPWEVGKYIQSQTLSTPYAWSQRMREWGVEGMALVDEVGRPANYAEQRALTVAQRDWSRRMQEFSLAQTGEQLTTQREWMTRGWAIEDQIRPLRQRYRVEDADMRILGLQNRLQDFQERQEMQEMGRAMEDRRFGWRMEDLETQGVRAGVQWGWQQQDFRENRQQFATQLGWQLEDFQEAIRFASGRQRRQLIEQRERAVVRAQWGRRDMAQAEERAEMRYEWGEEDREKAMARLREEYGMREEFQKKSEESEQRSLEYLQKQYEMAVQRREELVNQIIPAEEAQEALQREQAEMGLQWRERRHELDLAYYAEIQPLQEALTEKTNQMNEAWTQWQLVMSEGVPNAAQSFLKNFGPDSNAYKAIEKWKEALKSFEGLGQGGSAIGAAVDSKIAGWMDQQFPTYSLR